MTFWTYDAIAEQLHVMSMASSMKTLHLFSQDNQNEVQHVFGHVMHLVLASCDADGIVNGTAAFVS